jgi:hypothetical protein
LLFVQIAGLTIAASDASKVADRTCGGTVLSSKCDSCIRLRPARLIFVGMANLDRAIVAHWEEFCSYSMSKFGFGVRVLGCKMGLVRRTHPIQHRYSSQE